ncbi:MAG: hypothetical protein ACPGVT_09125 [Maricaulaceae bacterium]
MRAYSIPIICVFAVSHFAAADDFDRKGTRGETYCFPDKYAVKIVDRLADLKPTRRDVVDVNLDPKFFVLDGGGLPDRFFLRSKTKSEIDFTITTDGDVPDFFDVINAQGEQRGKNDLCIRDKARIGRPNDDEGLYFEMGLTPYFKNTSGVYGLDLLREGTQDGKKIYKCMIPTIARLAMPSTNHISVRFDDEGITPIILAIKDGVSKPIETEFYNEAYVFDVSPLRKRGVDEVHIKGGKHSLAPVPSVKTMRRYGIGEKNVTTQAYDTSASATETVTAK